MKVDNWRLNETVTMYISATDTKIIEQGTWVKPIHDVYVPEHVKKKHRRISTETYCYGSFGILPIPTKAIIKG